MVQSRSRNKDHLKFCKLYSVDKMACLLQLECSCLHGFFRCKLPMEVVDVEVKVTLMQGTHIFKRDRTTQLTKCILWTTKIHPHPNIINKMKTFLEVENKMGLSIPMPTPNSQFRPLLPETNPNICRTDKVEKRKTVSPKRKFKPVIPRVTATCPSLPQVPPKPSNEVPPTVRADTPWPGAGKMSGNLFEDRNWLLLKGYLAIENMKDDIDTPSLKEEPKIEKQSDNSKEEKCGWGPNCPFCKAQDKEGENPQQRPLPKSQAQKPDNMTKTRQQWETEMKRLNNKYNLDCFSDSELDSKSDKREEYQYEHGYETLI